MIALGVRALFLFAGYVFESPFVLRFHVESATLIFIVVGMPLMSSACTRGEDRSAAVPAAVAPAAQVWVWFAFCAAAAGLYFPSFSIGFLSDDYVLIDQAYRWRVGPFNPIAFRPFPLLAWSVALHSGSGSTALHLINVLLHGTNAYLASRVAESLLKDRMSPLLVGLLVLTNPIAPEAVAWCSGVFDVAATSLVLAMIIVAKGYDTHVSPHRRAAFGVLAIAAILSKRSPPSGRFSSRPRPGDDAGSRERYSSIALFFPAFLLSTASSELPIPQFANPSANSCCSAWCSTLSDHSPHPGTLIWFIPGRGSRSRTRL